MLCVQKLCFNGFMETDADLGVLQVGAHYKGRGEGTGPEHVRGGRELIRKCRLCGRPALAHRLPATSYLGAYLRDRKVLQRCGW